PVTGATNGVYPRHSLRTWQQQDPDGFNICIQAWQGVMNVTETDPYSWYEIAGIHGAPFKSWGEPNPRDPPEIGYCSHASGLFPTWHRIYVALLEQRLLVHAQRIASRFTGPDSRRYRDAGERCRISYWDWSETDVLPSVITTPRITVTTPDGPNEIANPLYSYRFYSDRFTEDFTGPFARIPNTARQPDRNSGVSRHDRVQAALSAGFRARRQNTYNVFSVDNFNAATNRAFRSNSTPGNLVSIESIHDEVHNAVGGQYGHMSYLEYSGFDPIFWLHHSNVDRIIAMYQAVHPGRGVEPQAATMNFANPMPSPGEEEDDLTPLRPFYDRTGRFYTSRDMISASSIFDFGYSYPEIPVHFRGRPDEELQAFTRSRVNALYG
ncbi:Di-copper centre-containing protein, partial [Ascodesmis nigricans]